MKQESEEVNVMIYGAGSDNHIYINRAISSVSSECNTFKQEDIKFADSIKEK